MDNIESRCNIGPVNMLFEGVSLSFSTRKFYRLGAVKGLNVHNVLIVFCAHDQTGNDESAPTQHPALTRS